VAALSLALIGIACHSSPQIAGDLADASGATDPTSAPQPLDAVAARRPDYRYLARALTHYRVLAADLDIPAFPTPPALPVRPGDSLLSIADLRARLSALGDLSADAVADADLRYGEPVVSAVKHFQRRHGLVDDGIVGRRTLVALQTPLAIRVRQIERAMERIRLQPPIDSGPLIIVNVAAFRLFAYSGVANDPVPTLSMRAIVGKAVGTPTPMLFEQLRYVDFRPQWNVPRSILLNEVIPHLRQDSTYLRREDMELVDMHDVARGDDVTSSVIDTLVAGTLRVRQRRGPRNALGLVKFVIPNDSNIYLHDTPEKQLFADRRRDFSHGCIRLEKARELAVWVLTNVRGWDADSVDVAMRGPEFRRVMLPRPIPVILEYNTAMATEDGVVWFMPDLYGLNPQILDK
jgi:murein L,D-transpeptidase YcbB/YkuD